VNPTDDTHPDVERLQLARWRTMTPAEKIHRVVDLNAAIRQLAAARIRAERPGVSEAELRLELARLWLPAELFDIARRHAAGTLAR
jgi:hypothetical protein